MIAGPDKSGEKQAVSPINGVEPPKRHRFKKGQSGNPNGRPAGESLTTKLRRILDEPDKEHGTKADALMAVAAKAARKGDYRFWNAILERMDGKVPDRFAGANGQELTIKVERAPRADRRI